MIDPTKTCTDLIADARMILNMLDRDIQADDYNAMHIHARHLEGTAFDLVIRIAIERRGHANG